MAKSNIFVLVLVTFIVASCRSKTVITSNLRHPYAMCEYDGGILISNFGGDAVDYNNTKATGFVTYYKNGSNRVVISAGNGLYSPKGMAVKESFLFVADVNKIVVFDLDGYKKVDEIEFPQGDAFVGDLLVMGNALFASVANYDRIYLLDITAPRQIDHTSLLEYVELPCPSTLKLMGEYILVSSNSFGKADREDKIIHIIDDLGNPSIRPIIHEHGDYQGLAFSPNKTRLIFCNQERNGYIGNLVFENGEYSYEQVTDDKSLLNSLLLLDGKMYICDLLNSKIYIKELIEFDNFSGIIKTD